MYVYTYIYINIFSAGGVRSKEDLELVRRLGNNKVRNRNVQYFYVKLSIAFVLALPDVYLSS